MNYYYGLGNPEEQFDEYYHLNYDPCAKCGNNFYDELFDYRYCLVDGEPRTIYPPPEQERVYGDECEKFMKLLEES